jgi:pantothenate kinase
MTVLIPQALTDAVLARAAERRVIVGISGGPGSGKSTLAAQLAEHWDATGAVVVPMDGFHFSSVRLEELGLAERKGAPETFDALALAALLAELATGAAASAPAYSRQLHEPVRDAIAVPATCRIVIVEGNYLGLDAEPWPAVRAHVDWLWRLNVPWPVARERLMARRVATGRDPAAAAAWVDSVDAANARLVAASNADVVLVPHGNNWRAMP